MASAKSVDQFFEEPAAWKAELNKLRDIIQRPELTEALKWGMPHYHYEGRNLFGICGFKSYFGIWFHQGAEMKDPAGVLMNAQPGKTKMMRQWRMTSASDINEKLITSYVEEAIRVAQYS